MKVLIISLILFVSSPSFAELEGAFAGDSAAQKKTWFLSGLATIHYAKLPKFESSLYLKLASRDHCVAAARSFEANQIRRMSFQCGDNLSCESVSVSCTNLETGEEEVLVDCSKYKMEQDRSVDCWHAASQKLRVF